MKNKFVSVEGVEIPRFGFGTYGLTNATDAISTAIGTGYRHIDTADIYGSHKHVGDAVAQSGVDREELFITTKIWKSDLEPEKVEPAIERFLAELQMDYVDLLLIHRPVDSIPIAETLSAMEDQKNKGRVNSLGVSNFNRRRLEEVFDTGIEIVNNQIEYHPSYQTQDLLRFCMKHDLSVTAYSPLGVGEDLKLDEVKN